MDFDATNNVALRNDSRRMVSLDQLDPCGKCVQRLNGMLLQIIMIDSPEDEDDADGHQKDFRE